MNRLRQVPKRRRSRAASVLQIFISAAPKRAALVVVLLLLAGFAESIGYATLLPVLSVAMGDTAGQQSDSADGGEPRARLGWHSLGQSDHPDRPGGGLRLGQGRHHAARQRLRRQRDGAGGDGIAPPADRHPAECEMELLHASARRPLRQRHQQRSRARRRGLLRRGYVRDHGDPVDHLSHSHARFLLAGRPAVAADRRIDHLDAAAPGAHVAQSRPGTDATDPEVSWRGSRTR